MGEIWNSMVGGMAALINWLYHATAVIGFPNYGLAIVLLTLLIKIVLYPLTQKQMVSMKRMTEIQPKVKEIQEKFKNKDPQKMQQKIMEVYKENNVNPMAGCLPILVQMPILIALYKALFDFEFLNQAHASFLWVADLSKVYPLSITSPENLLLPLLAGRTTFLQTRLTTSSTDQTQRMLLYLMPVFIGWICTTVPAGLALYWTTFNVLGYAQQYLVNKQLGQLKEGAPSK
ncbi:MAG: YidC/Oxa1 family membrane protein insertase [Firmicutes bacterium]|nr:YidC/Oxa1 family membrane protein insertase [Bacillota bacterium]